MSREVVLTAGALNTPKLLMLSGIGNFTELQKLGIPVLKNLPAVGRHFLDHPQVSTLFCLFIYII